MKLLVSNDHVVKYVSLLPIVLHPDHAVIGDLTISDMSASNAYIVDTLIAVPADWTGGAYLWVDGGFVRNPAYKIPGDARVLLDIVNITADKIHAPGTIIDLDNDEVKCPAGTTLTVQAEIRDGHGNLLPLTQSFCMPISCKHKEDVLLVRVVGGKAQFGVTLDSGVWTISSETINPNLPPQLQFTPFRFSVYAYRE